jgi:beta-lactamase regulating signal transducer with metallopeptidase domain
MAATLIVAGWMIWAGVCVIQLANATARVRRARNRSRAFPSALEAQLHHWTGVKAEGRQTRLVVSDDVRVAAVIGGGSPVIAVAPTIIGRLTPDELDRVVIHEWAHVQRRDDMLEVAQVIARTFAGWHPATWWLGRQLHIEREAACDEMAVTLTGSSKRYASCLLKLAGLPVQRQSVSPALGMLSSPVVSTRIQRIVNYHRHASPTWSTNAAGVGIVLLAGASCAIGSLRVVEAARVPSQDRVPVRAVAQSVSTAPASQAPRENVAAPDLPTPLPASRKTSRRIPDATSAAPRIGLMPASEPAAESTSFDVSSDPVEVEAIAADTPLTEPTVDAPPAASPQAPSDVPIAPWTAAANAGVSLGKRSKQGGVATGAFFSRLGKRIAGSF